MELIIGLGGTVFFLLLGLIVGGARERRHYRNLEEREANVQDMLITQLKTFPQSVSGAMPPTMMIGEAVIASDYMKSFLAGLRNIFGGEVKSFQRMADRARREATLRVVEQAREAGFNAVCNLRLETADIGGNNTQKRKGGAMSAILATGTAYYTAR